MCYSRKQKKILGRWLEGMGIAVVAGGIVTIPISNFQFWWFLIGGAISLVIGTLLFENNKESRSEY